MALKPARIVVLGIALAAAGGAYTMSRSAQEPVVVVEAQPVTPPVPTDKVLVARRDLPTGMLVNTADMDWQEWPVAGISPNMIRQSAGQVQLEDITGSIVRAAFLAGEPMRRDKLVKGNSSGFLSAILPAGHRAVAINIDANGSNTAGGFILSNDRVDILRTYRDEDLVRSGGDGLVTETLLRNIRVLAIGQNVQEKNGQTVMTGTTATLDLDEDQAALVIQAQRTSATGNLSLILRSMMDGPEQAYTQVKKEPEDGPVTLVRYGILSQIGKK